MDVAEWIEGIKRHASDYFTDVGAFLGRPRASFLFRESDEKLGRSLWFAGLSATIGLLALQFVEEMARPITLSSAAFLVLMWGGFAYLLKGLAKEERPMDADAEPPIEAIVFMSLGASYLIAALAAIVLPSVISMAAGSLSAVPTFFAAQFIALVTYLVRSGMTVRFAAGAAGSFALVAACVVFIALAVILFVQLAGSPGATPTECGEYGLEDPCDEFLCSEGFTEYCEVVEP